MGIKKANQSNKNNNQTPKIVAPITPVAPIAPENTPDPVMQSENTPAMESVESPEMIAIRELESEIVEETIKITTHQTSSCYELVQLGKQLLELRKSL